MMKTVVICFVFLLAACQPGAAVIPEVDGETEDVTEVNQPLETAAEELSESADSPATETVEETQDAQNPNETSFVAVGSDDPSGAESTRELSVAVTGPEEIVFDWTEDRCEDEHIPDIATRAFRDAEGNVQLWIGHYVNYRMIGPSLDEVESDCTVLMESDYSPDPAMFNDAEWLAAPYTEDGETVYAIMHNEYRGDTHSAARPGQCPSEDRLTCLDTSVTMSISTDGGDNFDDILEPPNHMVATMPYTFNDQGVPSGLRQPSNIIKGKDGYYYVYTNISDYPEDPADFPPQWVCAMRTEDLDDPSSWRYWDGEGFNGRFVNPYVEESGPDAPKCAELDFGDLAGSLNESVTYNTVLGKYMLVGIGYHPNSEDPMWGIYYSTSDDLVQWSERKLLKEFLIIANVADSSSDEFYAYPSLIDPDSDSMNFETVDDQAYLYITRLNNGHGSLDRDLIRYPVEITPPIYAPPAPWEFETEGDMEGWYPENQITGFDTQEGSLVMESSGGDPYMISPQISVPAEEYERIGIRMKASEGETTVGQLFFITEADPEWGEAKSLVFEVASDGEFHDYVLDMSEVEGWQGVVTQLRLDPVGHPSRDIEIGIIAFVE